MSEYDIQRAQAYFGAKTAFSTDVHQLHELLARKPDDVVVVDVRYPADFAKGHVPGAINLPKGRWHTVKGLRQDATHYVYCYDQSCHKAAQASLEFTQRGFKAIEVDGGWASWIGAYGAETAAAA
jgi:rhodanese-related sulfurtransferase